MTQINELKAGDIVRVTPEGGGTPVDLFVAPPRAAEPHAETTKDFVRLDSLVFISISPDGTTGDTTIDFPTQEEYDAAGHDIELVSSFGDNLPTKPGVYINQKLETLRLRAKEEYDGLMALLGGFLEGEEFRDIEELLGAREIWTLSEEGRWTSSISGELADTEIWCLGIAELVPYEA